MADPAAVPAPPSEDEIKPYRVRVSSKYLELTKQKLELTRLPHESSGSKSQTWWEPKSEVEPLIDYWLEHYSWRDQEEKLNASLPQFRTAIRISNSETPVRIHFIHAKSPHANAVPLLLIPPFPFTNLSIGHLIKPLTDPEDAGAVQPFHLVIPSLPGLGFSDALPNDTSIIPATAGILDELMKRLEYQHYIASNTGAGANSPAEIDWKLASYLSNQYSATCLGVHFISPPLASPKMKESPLEWTKWTAAKVLQRPMLGYSQGDLSALRRSSSRGKDNTSPSLLGLNSGGESGLEPNTLAYALCDSPTGLLLFIMKILRIWGAKQEFTPTETLNLTALTWLPGPEAVLRFWAHCASYTEAPSRKSSIKPKVSLTVFLNDGDGAAEGSHKEAKVLPRAATPVYSCPRWANTRYTVVSSERVSGKPGFLAWERPEVIENGVRKLAKAILSVDKRMQAAELPGAALLEQVVVEGGRTAAADLSGTTVEGSADVPASSPHKPAESPSHKPGAAFLAPPESGSKTRPQSGSQKPGAPQNTGEVQSTGPAQKVDFPPTIIAVPPASPNLSK